MRYDDLDNIIDTKVLSSYRKEVGRIADTFPKITTNIETVIVNVKPIVKKQTDWLKKASVDRSDGRDDCPVNLVLTPRARERQNCGTRSQAVKLFPERLEIIPNEMAEEVTMGGLADGGEVVTNMTAMKAITKDVVVIRPAPPLLRVEVLENTRTNENTVEACTDGNLVKNETTKLVVSMALVDLPQKLFTRGFLELAEEARIVDVSQTLSCHIDEVIPQVNEITKPMGNYISCKIEELMEQSVGSFGDVAMKVPMVRFDVGQLMRWPDMNYAGMMICEFTLESEVFSHGPARREAVLVFVSAESEVFTPVFMGGRHGDGPPSRGGGSYIASFCSADGRKRYPDRSVCGHWRRRPVQFKLG